MLFPTCVLVFLCPSTALFSHYTCLASASLDLPCYQWFSQLISSFPTVISSTHSPHLCFSTSLHRPLVSLICIYFQSLTFVGLSVFILSLFALCSLFSFLYLNFLLVALSLPTFLLFTFWIIRHQSSAHHQSLFVLLNQFAPLSVIWSFFDFRDTKLNSI